MQGSRPSEGRRRAMERPKGKMARDRRATARSRSKISMKINCNPFIFILNNYLIIFIIFLLNNSNKPLIL